MARIRSIKPELRTSLVVAEWPREVRYLWVLLWGYLDDHGYGVDDARLIKADCLPLDDDVTASTVDAWVSMMAGPVCRYEVDGKRFLHVPSWREHQRPQHPKDSKVPGCPHHIVTTPDEDRSEPPEPTRSDLHEDVMKLSGSPPEALTPEQGAGSREVEQGDVVASVAERAKRGRRIPVDFAVTPEMVIWARDNCPQVDGRAETQKFINYWRSKAGKDATKLDWVATWQNWMLNCRDRYGGARASPGDNGYVGTSDRKVAQVDVALASLKAKANGDHP